MNTFLKFALAFSLLFGLGGALASGNKSVSTTAPGAHATPQVSGGGATPIQDPPPCSPHRLC